MKRKPAKPVAPVVRLPAPEADFGTVIFRIAGQAFRVKVSATVEDLGEAPEPEVLPIDSAKPPHSSSRRGVFGRHKKGGRKS
jgi:hypothetical protein